MATIALGGGLAVPREARGVVVLAYASPAERVRSTSQVLGDMLHHDGIATLNLELLTPSEASVDAVTGHFGADVELLGGRVATGLEWLASNVRVRGLPVGLFGDGAACPAVLVAAAHLSANVSAVVGRGGQPDFAGASLRAVRAPTLLVSGSGEVDTLQGTRNALTHLVNAELAVIDEVDDPLADPYAFSTLCWLTQRWFTRHLSGVPA